MPDPRLERLKAKRAAEASAAESAPAMPAAADPGTPTIPTEFAQPDVAIPVQPVAPPTPWYRNLPEKAWELAKAAPGAALDAAKAAGTAATQVLTLGTGDEIAGAAHDLLTGGTGGIDAERRGMRAAYKASPAAAAAGAIAGGLPYAAATGGASLPAQVVGNASILDAGLLGQGEGSLADRSNQAASVMRENPLSTAASVAAPYLFRGAGAVANKAAQAFERKELGALSQLVTSPGQRAKMNMKPGVPQDYTPEGPSGTLSRSQDFARRAKNTGLFKDEYIPTSRGAADASERVIGEAGEKIGEATGKIRDAADNMPGKQRQVSYDHQIDTLNEMKSGLKSSVAGRRTVNRENAAIDDRINRIKDTSDRVRNPAVEGELEPLQSVEPEPIDAEVIKEPSPVNSSKKPETVVGSYVPNADKQLKKGADVLQGKIRNDLPSGETGLALRTEFTPEDIRNLQPPKSPKRVGDGTVSGEYEDTVTREPSPVNDTQDADFQNNNERIVRSAPDTSGSALAKRKQAAQPDRALEVESQSEPLNGAKYTTSLGQALDAQADMARRTKFEPQAKPLPQIENQLNMAQWQSLKDATREGISGVTSAKPALMPAAQQLNDANEAFHVASAAKYPALQNAERQENYALSPRDLAASALSGNAGAVLASSSLRGHVPGAAARTFQGLGAVAKQAEDLAAPSNSLNRMAATTKSLDFGAKLYDMLHGGDQTPRSAQTLSQKNAEMSEQLKKKIQEER